VVLLRLYSGYIKALLRLSLSVVSEAARGVWFHVLLITEDRNFQIDLSKAEPWQFKTFLVVSGTCLCACTRVSVSVSVSVCVCVCVTYISIFKVCMHILVVSGVYICSCVSNTILWLVSVNTHNTHT
jgi:hypothetical protein